ACTDYDQQSTTTSAFLGNASVLELNFGSFTPTVNDLFTIIQGNGTTGVNGTFATVTGLPAGFEVKYDFPNTGDVSVGDINYVGVSPLEFVVGNPTAGPNNTVTVPITVNHFDDIATFQGTFTFDPAVLTFSSASGPTGSTDFVAPYMNFGTPGTGNVPNNVVTFSWFEKNGGRLSQVDGTTVMELTFTVNGSATTGSTAIGIDGSSTALGYSNDVAATVLETPDVTAGGVTIDADPPTVLTASIQSNNANDISLATVGDVITLSFTSSEALPANPVVTIDRGGAGSITITDQGGATTWTAEKTVAAGDDGVVTFSISIQDQYGNTSVQTVTTDASSVTVDTEAPVLVNCPANIAQNNDLGICGAAITWTAPTATDNLPGVSVAQTAGDPSGSTFPVGNSQITYTATDAAGNTSSCSFDIDITDNEDPVVLTQNFSVTLDMTGAATITVNDIDAGSTDNCAIDTRVLSRTSFDCDDVPNSPITVTLTVTDIYGNSASADADVTVNLVPNISIAGDAKSELGTLIPSVDFDLDGDNGPQTANGSSYSFLVDPCDPVNTIGAERTGDASVNGIDINDALDVVRHTLLISQLNSPYKLIAADVNNSQTINVLDAFQILRRLLLITNSFTDPVSGNPGGVWTMIPSDYVFPNPQSPWGWDTRRSHTSVTAPLTGQDFTGVKLGDVNNSWDASPNRLAAPSDSIHFVIEAVQAQQGDLVRVPVKVANFDVISGYQFTMNWDESVLELKTVNHKALEALYNTEEAAKGHFTTAWIDMEGQAQSLADGTVAFELVFEVVGKRGSQTSFEINSALTESKALDMAKSRMGIGTIGGNVQVGAMTTSIDDDAFEGFALGQNSPNPFAEMTSLNFSLGQPQEVQISIFSMNGQLVRRFSGKFGTGQHEISWDGRNESGMKLGSGVYLVRMTADKFEASIKVRKTN
ncbi:MAG: HYR domain-containing protein, partial [Bacteroidia bacterium]|nr:HYR domain-containing protein [Bacteroidia bacterium]